jgi:hypothetical protein
MVTIAKERRPLFVPNESATAVISSSVVVSGAIQVTDSLLVKQGITGSLKTTIAGNPFIIAGSNITTNYNSLGQWVITATGEGGSGGSSGGGSTPTPVDVTDTNIALTNESIVNMVGLTAPRVVTLPSSPTTGKTIQLLNGDGSASSSSYVLVTGSSGELIDSKTYAHPALLQPYSFTQYMCIGNNWVPTLTKTKKLEESWIDYANSIGLTTTSTGYQDVTIGVQFTCISDSVLFGYRFKVNVDSSKSFDIKVWNNNQNLTTKTITVTGETDKLYFFDNPVLLSKGKTYFLTFRETSGSTYYYFYPGSAGYGVFPANLKTPAIILNAVYCYGNYDSQPNYYLNSSIGVFAPIEPIIFA